MSAGTDALKAAFRNFQADGIPASGANEPDKAEIRIAADKLAVDIAAAALGDLGEAAALLQPMVDDAETARDEAAASAAQLANVKQGVTGSSYIDGSLILANGSALSSGGWAATGFIPVEPNQTYRAVAAVTGTAYHAWYDANQVFISSFRGTVSGSLQTSDHAAPATARFARLSTSTLSKAGASFAPTSGRLSIEQVRDIAEAFPPILPAMTITYDGVTAEAEFDANRIVVAQLRNAVADMRNQLDEATDATTPVFIPITPFTKSHATTANAQTITIASRDSATQFTVAAGEGSKLAANGSCIVFDGANYHSLAIKAVAGNVITVFGALPAACVSVQTMHEANNGQHLGRFGHRALPEYIADYPRRNAYKKAGRLFSYWPPACSTLAGATNPDIYDSTATVLLVDITTLNGAGSGGWVAGTTDLGRSCSTSINNADMSASTASVYLTKYYRVQDGVAGRGIEFSFNAGGSDGFIEVPVAAARVSHNSGANVTEGRVRLQVLADGASIHDVTHDAGLLHMERIDFTRANAITVRMTLADSVPSILRMYGCNAWAKSPNTTADMFSTGDVVALLGDSWTQFPLSGDTGEVRPLRPDGPPAEGWQYMSERLRTYLADQGVNITTINFGMGSTTSAWGLYWLDAILSATPRPNKCIVNFGINDANSRTAASSSSDTVYDFDPAAMWVFKLQSAGGLKGAVTYDQYAANIKTICNRLSAAGIQPIVLLPPHTGSVSQSATLMSELAARVSDGFASL